MTLRMGIDTGGTFTDLVAFDEGSGTLQFHKVASTPADPGQARVRAVANDSRTIRVPSPVLDQQRKVKRIESAMRAVSSSTNSGALK